jgi:hypothetical protein
MVDTDLFVGVDNFDRSVLPDPTVALTPDLFITKLNILGSKMYDKYADKFLITNDGNYAGSNIAASVLGSISIKNISMQNDGTHFGIVGNSLEKYLKITVPGESPYVVKRIFFDLAQVDDFLIQVLPAVI